MKQLKMTTASVCTGPLATPLTCSDQQAGTGSLVTRERAENDWQEAQALLRKHPDGCFCQELCVRSRKTVLQRASDKFPICFRRFTSDLEMFHKCQRADNT